MVDRYFLEYPEIITYTWVERGFLPTADGVMWLASETTRVWQKTITRTTYS